jgi:peptidoglycan hydrolase CwlO-like protein
MKQERDKEHEAVSLAEFNDLKGAVADIASRVEAVEKHVRTCNHNENNHNEHNHKEQTTSIKDLLRRVEAIEQNIRQHHSND